MVKDLVKKTAYSLGLLPLFHNKQNRKALTVVLFHRVLPTNDIRWQQADKEWSVSDVFFRDCLNFFKKHYSLVSLNDIQECVDQDLPLPQRPLLISFDDGWRDNLEYALPMLQEFNIRPVLFVTTDAIGQNILSWQEALYSAWRINALTTDIVNQLYSLLNQSPQSISSEDNIRKLINDLQHAGDEVRLVLKAIAKDIDLSGQRQMLNIEELKALSEGFDLGTHGIRHEPLTQSPDPLAELKLARQQLADMTALPLPLSMSFPHGRSNEELIQQAKDAGYRQIFTGVECHNSLSKDTHTVFGRFNINQTMLENEQGRLLPELLAIHLFRRPVRSL